MRPTLAILVCIGLSLLTRAESIYVLLTPDPIDRLKDAFVLPLSRPEDIAHARDLILRGPVVNGEPNRPMATVRVAAGRDGINRNYLEPGFPEWSWHVGEFLGFADAAAEGQTSRPFLVEGWAMPPGYSQVVSFDAHTITKELGPAPLWLGANRTPEGLMVSWSGLGTNYVYTLELVPNAADFKEPKRQST